MIKNQSNVNYLERTNERSNSVKTHQSKFKKVLSFVGKTKLNISLLLKMFVRKQTAAHTKFITRTFTLTHTLRTTVEWRANQKSATELAEQKQQCKHIEHCKY